MAALPPGRLPDGRFPDLLRDLQQQLAILYDLRVSQDVRDYLVTDAGLLHALTDGVPGRDVDEKLILVEDGEGMAVALYLDARLLERLAEADPRCNLGGHNLADFWTVLEGISHFNYFAWNATLDKQVTLLELEMQAEIDKYLGTRALMHEQPASDLGGPLMKRLFEDPGFMAALSEEEVERYRSAGHLAGRYCASLESRYPHDRLAPEMIRELRAFYRLPQSAKVSRIRAAHFT